MSQQTEGATAGELEALLEDNSRMAATELQGILWSWQLELRAQLSFFESFYISIYI